MSSEQVLCALMYEVIKWMSKNPLLSVIEKTVVPFVPSEPSVPAVPSVPSLPRKVALALR